MWGFVGGLPKARQFGGREYGAERERTRDIRKRREYELKIERKGGFVRARMCSKRAWSVLEFGNVCVGLRCEVLLCVWAESSETFFF